LAKAQDTGSADAKEQANRKRIVMVRTKLNGHG
jgi:hypothetical protein